MTTKLTHPADGIYATSVERLRELGACKSGQQAFCVAAKRMTGTSPSGLDVVLVTLALLSEIMAIEPCLAWLLGRMHVRGLITERDLVVYWNAYDRHEWGSVAGQRASARAVMDTLLVRAKREGLVS